MHNVQRTRYHCATRCLTPRRYTHAIATAVECVVGMEAGVKYHRENIIEFKSTDTSCLRGGSCGKEKI